MIGYLEGAVRAVRNTYCVVLVGGVGYEVAMTKESLTRLSEGAPITVWTYLAVREDALDLYGFQAEDELRFFEKLLTVSGIGPKSALGILDIAAVETLRSAVATGNASYLTQVAGIGKKTAEKIVLELKDKMGSGAASILPKGELEALEAMRALGYSAEEAREALRKVPADIERSNDRLREALRLLAQKP